MDLSEININNTIIHVLDSDHDKLILSNKIINYDSEFQDFIKGHIIKILKGDDARNCEFREYSEVENIVKSEEDFVLQSQQLAEKLFTLMQKYKKIPAADLIITSFGFKGVEWLALLKVNYIGNYVNAFPKSMSTNLKEAALINLKNYSLIVKEKKFEVDGIKANYFSGYFLRCTGDMSEKEKLRTLKNALVQVRSKYLHNDVDKLIHSIESKLAITKQMEERGRIDTKSLADQIFKDNMEAKQFFLQMLKKKYLSESIIIPKNNDSLEKVNREKIVTDSGIIIIIPANSINKNNVCINTNPQNGTSIEIRNILRIKNY